MSAIIVIAAVFPLSFAAVTDVRFRVIPDWTAVSVLILAIIKLLFGFQSFDSVILGFVIAAVFFAVAMFARDGSVGGGDVKLLSAICLFCGGVGGVAVFVIAGIICVCICAVTNNKQVPMAPAILIAFVAFHILQFFILT